MLQQFLRKLVGAADSVRMYGRFTMSIYDVKNGQQQLVRRIQKKNQVVNDGRSVMLQLLRPNGLVQAENQIWSLSVGTDGTPPLITDVDLLSPVWSEAFTPAECVVGALPPFEIQIFKSLPTAPCSANGYVLREAAVFTRGTDDDPSLAANRRMFCRQIHSAVEKTDTMTILYDWRLGVTVEGA